MSSTPSAPNGGEESFGEKVKRTTTNFGHSTGLCCFKVKKQSQIALLEKQLVGRQRQFGVDYITAVNNKEGGTSNPDTLRSILHQAKRDIDEIQKKINEHYDNIDHKEAEIENKIVPPASTSTSTSAPVANSSGGGRGRGGGPGSGRGGGGRGAAAAGRGPPSPSAGRRPPVGGNNNSNSNHGPAGRGGRGTGPRRSTSPTKSRNPAKNSGGGGGGGGSPKPIGKASAGPKEDIPEAYRNVDPTKWKIRDIKFSGSATYDSKGREENVAGQTIAQGIQRFKANPGRYTAMMYQTTMQTEKWPAANCKYILIHREGTTNYRPQGVSPKGWMTILLQDYERLKPFPDDVLPKAYRDKYTDAMTFQRRALHAKHKPIMPGRGMGVGDTPLLKIIGDVDPSDISQGQVGDCWLLSGISSLAEFDGAIKKLFRKTKDLDRLPNDDGPNMYTITLWDLTTWKEVDIQIDERLPCSPDGKGLLASRPSEDGELWAPYLEKALAIHCGGWDKIVGGQCTHAWSLLTGCKEQYTIRINPKTNKYECVAKYDPYKKQWARHGNSPHDSDPAMWRVAWPTVGGGGGMDVDLTEKELFLRMVAWDKQNYIVGAGTRGTSDKHSTDGLVDNHAYSVIASYSNVAGTGVDLLKVRNPWGRGEIEDGEFDDDGPGWKRYPQIKKLLNPVVADDGIFWVTRKEFFHFFSTLYLSASDMTKFLED